MEGSLEALFARKPRSVSRKNLKNSNIKLAIGDVSSIAKVDALASEIGKQVDQVNVLINNVGYFGDAMKTNEDDLELSFAVNIMAPCRLPQQKEKKPLGDHLE